MIQPRSRRLRTIALWGVAVPLLLAIIGLQGRDAHAPPLINESGQVVSSHRPVPIDHPLVLSEMSSWAKIRLMFSR